MIQKTQEMVPRNTKVFIYPLGQEGFVLVFAMVTMLIVLVMGIFASQMSTIGNMIVGVERIYKENFYQAEGTAMEAAETCETASNVQMSVADNATTAANLPGLVSRQDLVAESIPTPATGTDGLPTTQDVKNSPEWKEPILAGISRTVEPVWSTTVGSPLANSNERYLVVYIGVPPEESLKSSGSKIHQYFIYGQSQANNSDLTIRLDYRKAFEEEE